MGVALMEVPFRLSATQEVFGVSVLTALMKEQIESNFAGVWVRGEVSNLTRSAAGHHYFNLREENALLKAVLFKGRGRFFSRHLKEGTEVICYGDITVYEPRGEYQLIVEFVEPAGLGALFAQLEYLKKRLSEEGLFAEERKRAIPTVPHCVALVASHASAALQDMLRILEAYPLPLEVLVYPIASQGDDAPPSICSAFQALARHGMAQVAVLARGGGSVEDLWAFNHESVVRAVAASPVPVITGIGHETDTTLADLAADLRAPTPTAAAEVLVSNALQEVQRFTELRARMVELLSHSLSERRASLVGLRLRLDSLAPERRLREQRLHLLRLSEALCQSQERRLLSSRGLLQEVRHRLQGSSPSVRIATGRERLRALQVGLRRGVAKAMQDRTHRLRVFSERLKGLSPEAPLERGYALCLKNGRAVYSARDLERGDKVVVRFLKDAAKCQVVEAPFSLAESGEDH